MAKCHSEQLELGLSPLEGGSSLGCLGSGWQAILIFIWEQLSPLARKILTQSLKLTKVRESKYYRKELIPDLLWL